MERRRRELRRHSRVRVNWPTIPKVGTRLLQVELLNLAPSDAKVRVDDELQEGTAVKTPPSASGRGPR
jgi:hypothetical protein